jgi:uracil-DNA glycosylase
MMFDEVAALARACTVCAPYLPLGPRPVFRALPSATMLIVSQAPGTRAHNSDLPWNDESGDRLRGWLAVNRESFYDKTRIAIVPMGLCYPGRQANGGDNPPRPECAPLWQQRFRAVLPNIRLTLLIGSYAQAYHLGKGSVESRVQNFRNFLPSQFPLPHPSWRTRAWAAKRPWFETEVLPALRQAVATAIE